MADIDKVVRDGKTAGWQARWRDPDGRQRKKTLRTKIEAEKFLAAMRTDMAHGTYIDPRAGKVTVEAWAPLYLAGLAHLKVTTRERYAGIVRLHVLPRWGRRPLASIGHAEVVGWVSELSEQGLSADSVRYVHRVFSLMLDLAVRDGRIGRNPAARVTMPRVSRREPVFLRPEDLARLVAVAGPDGPALRFLALTGLRFGEFAALRVRHVDLERRRLTVAESVSEVGGRLVWSSTKSHKTRRVPIAASLVRDLTVRCSYREADELVFTAPQGGPLRINNWRPRVFDPACERAGLTGLTPHDLRHTAASLAVSAGATSRRCSGCWGTPRPR